MGVKKGRRVTDCLIHVICYIHLQQKEVFRHHFAFYNISIHPSMLFVEIVQIAYKFVLNFAKKYGMYDNCGVYNVIILDPEIG